MIAKQYGTAKKAPEKTKSGGIFGLVIRRKKRYNEKKTTTGRSNPPLRNPYASDRHRKCDADGRILIEEAKQWKRS